MSVRSLRFNGARLRTLRNERSWSQSQLAGRIGAHVTSISDWERGDNAPSGRHVVNLAREFGVTADHFYGDDDAEPASMAAGGPLNDKDYELFGRLSARILIYRDRA